MQIPRGQARRAGPPGAPGRARRVEQRVWRCPRVGQPDPLLCHGAVPTRQGSPHQGSRDRQRRGGPRRRSGHLHGSRAAPPTTERATGQRERGRPVVRRARRDGGGSTASAKPSAVTSTPGTPAVEAPRPAATAGDLFVRRERPRLRGVRAAVARDADEELPPARTGRTLSGTRVQCGSGRDCRLRHRCVGLHVGPGPRCPGWPRDRAPSLVGGGPRGAGRSPIGTGRKLIRGLAEPGRARQSLSGAV